MFPKAALILVTCVVAGAPLMAADGGSLPGSGWASIAKLPDFNGVWEITFGGVVGGPQQKIALTPSTKQSSKRSNSIRIKTRPWRTAFRPVCPE